MSHEEQETEARYLWDLRADDTVRLLRVYASPGEFCVPEQIEGKSVTVIGSYCFADSEHLDGYELRESPSGTACGNDGRIPVFAGEAVEKLCLPDSVHTIENLAFYNCRRLRSLETGVDIQNLGSDVFMNCSALEEIGVRCGIEERSGASVLLGRISSEILLHFLGGKSVTEAKLLYPEYFETYDEIAPAHIFGRNITGEGFRARQLFADGMVQLSRYDEIFDKAAAEESPLTSGRLALLRLLYPAGLSETSADAYQQHVRKNADVLAAYYIARRELGILQKMCERHYLSGQDLEQAIQDCITEEWGEGSASLMEWKQKYDRTDRKERYLFEDF